MSKHPANEPGRLTLEGLIDLEVQLDRDSDRPLDELRQRDGRIAHQIGAAALEGPALYLRWLAEVRRSEGGAGAAPTPGQRVGQVRRLVGGLLAAAGLVMGAAAVGGWLASADGRPVNVIWFWTVLIALQLLLLAGWVAAVVRWARRSGRGDADLASAAPTLAMAAVKGIGAALARLSPPWREALNAAAGRLRRRRHLYGRLQFWLLMQTTQTFAIAFNIGAVAALVLMALATDPSFGWRSTLLGSEQVHAASRAAAWPWAGWLPSGAPTLEQVEATRYSTLDERFLRGDGGPHTPDAEVWAAWWPFLLGSLVAYGLLPRLAAWGLCRWRVHRELGRVRLDHAEFQRLRDRLKRPFVQTTATEPETPARRDPDAATAATGEPAMTAAAAGPCLLLKWAGVPLEGDRLAALVRERFGWTAMQVNSIGGLDEAADEAALEQAAGQVDGDEPLVLAVEGWEPPVGDYLDFLRELRRRAGAHRPIIVLVTGLDERGRPAAPRDDQLDQWRVRLATLGDPWLRIEPTPAPAPGSFGQGPAPAPGSGGTGILPVNRPAPGSRGRGPAHGSDRPPAPDSPREGGDRPAAEEGR